MDAQLSDGRETLESVLSDIRKGKIVPCYLLYGEEEYLVNDAFQKILDLLLPDADRALNLYSVNGAQENINDICLTLLAAPLIPGKKIVAVKDTSLFQSKKIMPGLIKKIRDDLESNPSRAGKDFLRFLKLAGWKIEELKDGGWKSITGEEWQKNTQGDSGEDRDKWLPKIIDLCTERGLKSAASDEDAERLSRAIAGGFPEGNYLILTAQDVDKRKQLFKQIAETGKTLYFPRPKGESKQKFLFMEKAQDLLSRQGKKLSPDAWQAMGRKTGFDLRKSMAALEKLIVYAGEKKVIEASDIEEVVGKTKEDNVFDLTTALLERNLAQSLLILQYLIEQGLHHLVILKMITREIRLLLYAKLLVMSKEMESYDSNIDYNRFQAHVYPKIKALGGKGKDGIGSLSSQHPYVIFKLLKNSEKFTYKNIVKYMEQLAEMDMSLRSTGKDPKLQLERFLAEVCLN